jgi:hypothetical protein
MQRIIITVLLTGFIAATATSPVNAAGGARAPASTAPSGTTTTTSMGGDGVLREPFWLAHHIQSS